MAEIGAAAAGADTKAQSPENAGTIPADLALPSIEELSIDLSPDAVPKVTDQFLQQYVAGRDAFLEREDSTRSDASFRQSLNPLAREACNIVSRIRAHEHKNLWIPTGEEGSSHVYPGMPFHATWAKQGMEKSILWKIVRKMPKGCLLHAHFDALFDSSWLIEKALEIPGIAFKSDLPLTDEKALDSAKSMFQYVGESALASDADAPSIYSSKYQPESFVSARKAASEFKATAKYKDFVSWLCTRNTVSSKDALDPTIDTWAIWAKFRNCFAIFNSLITYEPIFRAALQRLFTELAADGIKWAEFRYCFINQFWREGHTEPEADYMHMMIIFDQELGKFQDTPQGQKFWGARFIWTGIRSASQEDIQKNMTECIRHKAMFPHLIAAYDLVGQEEKGKPLVDLLPIIFWFRKAVAAAELNIPFVFHAGETMETGTDTTRNMYDAVLLGTRRIGHGFALYKHPLLMDTVKSKNICIESCPLSNEILRLTSSVMSHPLPALIAKGVKCTISNDDPAILGGPDVHSQNGTSREMWSMLQSWGDLGLAGLGSLAMESVRFALFEVPDTVDESTKEWNDSTRKGLSGTGLRADRMREWRLEWDEFIEWVLVEYAAEWGGDDDE